MESLFSTAWNNNSRPTRKLNRASALFDAFGRLRVADVSPLFDSKLSLGIESIGATSSCAGGLGIRHLV